MSLAITAAAIVLLPVAGRGDAARVGEESVFKIYVTLQRHNYAMPWQATSPSQGTGTGFLIGKRRILTNAHLVADARFIQVQRSGDARRYDATVQFVAHDCDLAAIEVSDPEFFRGTRGLTLAKTLPRINEDVMVLGYPMGGERLSVTRGVVSRLDFANYAHSGIDSHLVLQVDAAINPGNSGGPVMQQDRVVGVAFQGISLADNIGYAIPLPVINHFVADIEDGTYHGYPELGIAFMNLRNPALRRHLKLPDEASGIAVTQVDPFGSAWGLLNEGDVLLSIDGHSIDNAGNTMIDGHAFLFAELIERKQWGDNMSFSILRQGTRQDVVVPLTNPTDPFIFRNSYDERPEYLIEGGLVFSPMSRELMQIVDRQAASREVRTLLYLFVYGKLDGYYRDRSQYVVFSRRLPHPVNSFMDNNLYGVVARVNGQPIGNLRDLKQAFDTATNEFQRIDFIGNAVPLILDAKASKEATRQLIREHGIAERDYIRETP